MKVLSALMLVAVLFGSASALTCEYERCCEIAQQGLMYYGNRVFYDTYGGGPGTAGVVNTNCPFNGDVFDRNAASSSDCLTQSTSDNFYPEELIRICPRNYALYNLMCESQSDLTNSFPVRVDNEMKDQYNTLDDCLRDENNNYNYDRRQCLDFWYTAFDRCMRSLGIRGGN